MAGCARPLSQQGRVAGVPAECGNHRPHGKRGVRSRRQEDAKTTQNDRAESRRRLQSELPAVAHDSSPTPNVVRGQEGRHGRGREPGRRRSGTVAGEGADGLPPVWVRIPDLRIGPHGREAGRHGHRRAERRRPVPVPRQGRAGDHAQSPDGRRQRVGPPQPLRPGAARGRWRV